MKRCWDSHTGSQDIPGDYRTYFRMPVISWNVLASSVAVPAPLHNLNMCRTSWNSMNSTRHRSMMMDMTFHITPKRHIPQYSPPPLGRRMTVFHVQSNSNYPMSNIICIISMTIHHLEGSGFYSACAAISHIFKCSARIPDGPLAQFGLM